MPNQKGSAPLIVILGILVILGIAGGTYYSGLLKNKPLSQKPFANSQNSNSPQDKFAQLMKELGCNSPASCMTACIKPENHEKCQSMMQGMNKSGMSSSNDQAANQENQYSSRNDLPPCNGNAMLSKAPANPDAYQYIIPLGNVSTSNGQPSHVVPTDHIYFSNPPSNNRPTTPIYSEAQAVAQLDTIPVFSPGNIRIVEVDAKTYTDSTHNFSSKDYSIYFSTCKDVVFYFHHITNINSTISNALDKVSNKQCGSQPLDNFIIQSCNYFNTSIDLKEGDKLGLGAFDMGMFDYQQQPAAFVDQAKATTLYAACPLDYFTEPAKTQMYQKVKNTKLNAQGLPDCGTNMQDVPGTIAGNWYLPGTQDQNQGSVQNDHEMSIIHLNTNPSMGVIDWGGGIATANQLHFQISANGTLNREPIQVKADGQVYCYQGQTGPADQPFPSSNQLNSHILFQLTDSNTLKAEYGPGECPSPTTFSKPVMFIR